MPYDWKDKVVLVTGASSGIGRALAVELGKRGARVGLTARRADELLKVAGEVERAGGRALALPADVRSAEEMKGVAARLRESWGGVDVLVANAGMSTTTFGAELDAAEAGDELAVPVGALVHIRAPRAPEKVGR